MSLHHLTRSIFNSKRPGQSAGNVVFSDNFNLSPNGWSGSTGCIEAVGCSYNSGNSGLHMAYEPAGPIYKTCSGLIVGKTYQYTFYVSNLHSSDVKKVTFSIDSLVSRTLGAVGTYTGTFVATATSHVVKFNWGFHSITMAPIHVRTISISAV